VLILLDLLDNARLTLVARIVDLYLKRAVLSIPKVFYSRPNH
jgi:hypothetical protein